MKSESLLKRFSFLFFFSSFFPLEMLRSTTKLQFLFLDSFIILYCISWMHCSINNINHDDVNSKGLFYIVFHWFFLPFVFYINVKERKNKWELLLQGKILKYKKRKKRLLLLKRRKELFQERFSIHIFCLQFDWFQFFFLNKFSTFSKWWIFMWRIFSTNIIVFIFLLRLWFYYNFLMICINNKMKIKLLNLKAIFPQFPQK